MRDLIGSVPKSVEKERGASSEVIASRVAVGDLDGDSRVDLAVASLGTSTVSVLLGNGDGTFVERAAYRTGDSPRCVAIGDLNGDGNPDLALASFSSNAVSVLLGDGRGGFGARTDYGTGGGPLSVAIGDLNGDSKPDLAVATYYLGGVTTLLNVGASIPTATLLSLFEVRWAGASVQIRWRFDRTADVTTSDVERSTTVNGSWIPVSGPQWAEGETQVSEDRNVGPRSTFFYRIVASLASGGTIITPPMSVSGVPPTPEFVLSPIGPSPTHGAAQIEFLMPRGARVQVTVLDVSGRQVTLVADGTYPAGRHETAWNATSGNAAARSGLYFVCFEWPGGRAIRRLVLTR